MLPSRSAESCLRDNRSDNGFCVPERDSNLNLRILTSLRNAKLITIILDVIGFSAATVSKSVDC